MGHIYKRKNTYWIKYYRDGKPFYESSHSKKESDAKHLLKLREGDIARGVPVTPKANSVTLGELAEDVINDYRVNRRKSVADQKARFEKNILPFFGRKRRSASISTSSIRKYIVKRQKEGAANATINRELSALKRAFSLAAKADPPKLFRKPYVPMLVERNVRSGFFEPDAFACVLGHLSDDLKPLIQFLHVTGWRKSEAVGLQWRNVDMENGWVSLDPGTTKNDEPRTFPFTEALRTLFEGLDLKRRDLMRRGIVCPWVFHRRGRHVRCFKKAWRSACQKSGLTGALVHDLRRTAVRDLVRAGVPERVAMQLTGHKTRSVFERYNIVSERDLRDAAQLLDTVTKTVTLGHQTEKG